MTTCVFVQIRCTPGTTYAVAEEIALREIHSELYSTSGEYDLLLKLYEMHKQKRQAEGELEARINTFELAYRMQTD